jgi:hypothetical protein
MGEAVRSNAWPRFALLYAALDATFGSASPLLSALRSAWAAGVVAGVVRGIEYGRGTNRPAKNSRWSGGWMWPLLLMPHINALFCSC